MATDDVPFLPRWFIDIFDTPRNTPTIPEQLPSQPRRPGQPNSPPKSPDEPGTLTEVDEGFAGPLPVPRDTVRPPKLPPGTAPTSSPLPGGGGSPADTLPPRLPAGRPARLPATASVLGALAWVYGALVFGPFFRGVVPQPRTAGPPRRNTRRPPVATSTPRFDCTWTGGALDPGCWQPMPRAPGARIPQGGSLDDPASSSPTVPARPRTVPGTRTPVQRVPTPAQFPAPWGLGDPLPGPGYDPFTVAPPTPAPRAAPPRPGARRTPVLAPLLPGWISDPTGSPTRGVPRVRPRPLTPQQPARAQPRGRTTPLTPLQDPVPRSEPLGLRKPTSANPCTTERTARRRRQQECRRYTTKEIRVCADRS